MDHYAGIDVSLECSSVCVVDASGKIVREDKVASEPEALIAWFGSLGFEPGADRAGGRAAVAMALRGDAGGGPCGRAAGDAARARRLQGDAGEERPQRRARHRAADAAGLVPAGALQVDGGAGDARAADRAQAGAVEAARHRDEPARDSARLRPEGRARPRRSALRGGSGSWWPAIRPWRSIAAALLAVHAVLLREFDGFEKRVRTMARADARAQAVDVDARRRARSWRSPMCRPSTIRRGSNRRRQVGAHFGLTPKKYQSGETDITGRISKIGDAAVRTALYEAAHIILTGRSRAPASRAGRCGSPSAPA